MIAKRALLYCVVAALVVIMASCYGDDAVIEPTMDQDPPSLNSGYMYGSWDFTEDAEPHRIAISSFRDEGTMLEVWRMPTGQTEAELRAVEILAEEWYAAWELISEAERWPPKNKNHGCGDDDVCSESLLWFTGDHGRWFCIESCVKQEYKAVRTVMLALRDKYFPDE